jgi:hypothetical protein
MKSFLPDDDGNDNNTHNSTEKVYMQVRTREREDILIVLSSMEKGWRSRCTLPIRFRHNYVSCESVDDIVEWWKNDECRSVTAKTREECLELLGSDNESFLGSFHCEAALSPSDRAERVLRHLESS